MSNLAANATAMKIETPAEKLARLERENDALRAQVAKSNTPRNLSLKIGDKGGLSVYGMGRFPVTLYVEQWERLIGFVPEIKAFIEAHRGELKLKGE